MTTALKILLIDDEPSVLFALKLLLEALGHTVRDFGIPMDAVAHLRQSSIGHYDLILCDLRMPEINGFNVLREAKRIRPELPFVLMSGHATEDEVQLARSLGAHGFLGKPFAPDELKRMFVQILTDSRGQTEATSSSIARDSG